MIWPSLCLAVMELHSMKLVDIVLVMALIHTESSKNSFVVWGEGTTDDVNNSVGTAEKQFIIKFTKAKTKFCLRLHYDEDNYLFARYLF